MSGCSIAAKSGFGLGWSTYDNLGVVCLRRAARDQVPAVGEVDDLGVALLERARLPGGDAEGRGGGESHQEGEGSKSLHVEDVEMADEMLSRALDVSWSCRSSRFFARLVRLLIYLFNMKAMHFMMVPNRSDYPVLNKVRNAVTGHFR